MRTLSVIFQQLFTQAQTHLSIILNAQIFYGCASSTLRGKRYYIVYICACIARTLSAVLSVKMSVEHNTLRTLTALRLLSPPFLFYFFYSTSSESHQPFYGEFITQRVSRVIYFTFARLCRNKRAWPRRTDPTESGVVSGSAVFRG